MSFIFQACCRSLNKARRRDHLITVCVCVGGGECLPHTYCLEWVPGCSSPQHLQPPPPPAPLRKTPTLPTADSNSAAHLHGYACLLRKIKPLHSPFAASWIGLPHSNAALDCMIKCKHETQTLPNYMRVLRQQLNCDLILQIRELNFN